MSDEQQVKAQPVAGYAIIPTDDRAGMGLVLRTVWGLIGYSFRRDDFAHFAATVVAAAGKAENQDPDQNVHTIELSAEDISFESDPAEPSVVTVTTRHGAITLTVSVDAETLFPSLKQFFDARRAKSGK